MTLLLVVVAWRLARWLAAPVLVVALSMLLLHSGSFARHDGPRTLGAVERVVQPIEHNLQHALGKALRP
jgi:protein-S-isoprenylcysteine O-methyltransferase Ste14